jgi:hypothetical protein
MLACGIVIAVLIVGALAWLWGREHGYSAGIEDGYRLARDHRDIV